MTPPSFLIGFPHEDRARRVVLPLWIGYVILIVVGTWLLEPERQSVIRHYRAASLAWMAGESMYSGTGHGFLYLPSFAVLHTPFALLPFEIGGALWRILNLGLFGFGLWRLVCSTDETRRASLFLVASACVLPLAWSSARHGQATLAMAGAMLGAAGDIADRRYRRAALWCGVGLAIKPLIVVFLLLAAAANRRLILPLLAAIAAVLLLPWLAQAPSYVRGQYVEFAQMLRMAGDPTQPLIHPDLITGLRFVGVPISKSSALGLRVIAAIATLLLYLRSTRRLQPSIAAVCLYTLAAAYLLLFNPRTEHNTYSLIGPAIGMFAALGWIYGGSKRLTAAYFLIMLCIWLDRDVLRLILGGNSPWTKSLLVLIFLTLAVIQLRSRYRGTEPLHGPGAAE